MSDRRDIVRAVRHLLINEWDPTNVDGVDTETATTDDSTAVLIHTGTTADTVHDPQIVVEAAGETPRSGRGYYGTKADGSGFVSMTDGTLDIRCVGGDADAAGTTHPRYLTRLFTEEVKEIVHANPEIVNPDTGELEYRSFVPGQRRGPLLDDDVEGRWYAVQEALYTEGDDPPTR